MKISHWLLAIACCAAVAPAVASKQAPTEVTSRHWSYQAIEDMASRGLVHGYRDAKFLGGRTLTRFEMASLVKRILDNLLIIPLDEGRLPEAETGGTAATRGQKSPLDVVPTGHPLPNRATRVAPFTEADLQTTRKLVEHYSVELAVIGADLTGAEERLTALEGRVEQLEKTLNDPKGPLQKAISDIARLDKIRFNGAVQARFEAFENTREADPPGSRQAVTNRFHVRRVRLTANARPTEHIGARWQIDGAGSTVETRDAWIDYFFSGNPATGYTATIGQMKVPFGYELVQSSTQRETPERARATRFFFPGERDRGVKLAAPTGNKVFYEIGLFNGLAPGRPAINVSDNNNDKDVTGRVRTSLLDEKLDVGASFALGHSLRTALAAGETPRPSGAPSTEDPYENKRLVLGADFQWYATPKTKLQGEYFFGKANGTYASGYYLLLAHSLNERNQLVAKYDWFGARDRVLAPVGGGGTPVGDAVSYEGTLSNLALGWIFRVDSSTRLKLFHEFHGIGREELNYGKVPWQGDITRFEIITLF